MAAHAQMSRNWAGRMALVTGVFGAFAIWCLYDALVAYPQFNRRAAEYNRLLAAGRLEDWPALARDRGWRPGFGKDDLLASGAVVPKTPWDIGTQYVMLTGAAAVSAFALLRVLRARRRRMEADDQGFRTVEGALVPYADITAIDLALWQRKSIARVHYRRAGRPEQTLIDDWIYRGGAEVLAEVQRRTGLVPPGPASAVDTVPACPPATASGDKASPDDSPR